MKIKTLSRQEIINQYLDQYPDTTRMPEHIKALLTDLTQGS